MIDDYRVPNQYVYYIAVFTQFLFTRVVFPFLIDLLENKKIYVL